MLNKLQQKQKVILILIAGLSSIIGLIGLSKTYVDYYATAAIAKGIFTALLLFVFLSPFYFISEEKNLAKNKPMLYLLIILTTIFSLIVKGVVES